MKKITIIILTMLSLGEIFAQKDKTRSNVSNSPFSKITDFLSPKGDAGYMGLWDWGVSIGTINEKTHGAYNNNTGYLDEKVAGEFIKVHFQESLLSFYTWDMKSDHRVKFGVVEKLELGVLREKNTRTTNMPSTPVGEPKIRYDILIAYEGGLGVVYKINDNLDAGISYYFFSLSKFDKETYVRNYPKFRFRYNHAMLELNLGKKHALDLRYLIGTGKRDYTKYIGISLTGWKEKTIQNTNANKKSASYIFLTVGGIF